MKNKTSTTHSHASIAEIAAALSVSRQAAAKRAASEDWKYIEQSGPGGRRKLYPISSLPAETQVALAARALKNNARVTAGDAGLPDGGAGSTPDPRAESLASMYDAKPEKLKARARARLEIVQKYHQLLAHGLDRAAVADAVVRERSISRAKLSRLLDLVKGKPGNLWLYHLCERYAGRTALAPFSAEAWEYFKAEFLRAERPTLKACAERTRRAGRAHGWIVPDDKTIKRRVDREIGHAGQVYARRGREAAMQLYPAQERTYSALAALEIVNGDGYKHNLWVAFPDGEIRRAHTWFWQDVYSRMIVGFRVDKTEHTDQIRLSFGELIKTWGIPDAVLLDNTRAAANKEMSGGVHHRFRFTVKAEEPWGVFRNLGIDVRWATPRHGQSKPIERIFGIGGIGEYVDKAPEFAGAWTGASPLDKPDYDGKTRAIPLAALEAVIAREVAALNAKVGRRTPLHKGRSFEDVFRESYARTIVRRATEEQQRLWLLSSEGVRVKPNGTVLLDSGRMVGERAANRYWNGELLDHIGQMVCARFDPKRLHEGAHIYTLDGRYICFADCVDPAAFDDREAAREHQRNRKTFIRSTRTALQAEVRMDALVAAKRLPERARAPVAAQTIPSPKVVRAEFRAPIEAPRELTAAEAPHMAEAEALAAAPLQTKVADLRGDPAKHDHWLVLDGRRRAGEVLADNEEVFWKAWQSSAFFRIQTELDEEFQQRTATGG